VLLGPDGNPVIGAAVSLRPNSCRSNMCELLDDANSSHWFAPLFDLSPGPHWPSSSNTLKQLESSHSQWLRLLSSNPQWPESPELLAMLHAVNHMPPAQHAMAQIQAFEDTPKLASIPMDKIRQTQAVGDNLALVAMGVHSSETDLPCSPERPGTTVLAGLLVAVESSNSPA